MKQTPIIIAIILVSALSLHSQESFDLQGGLNIANLSDPGNLIEGGVWYSRLGFVTSASTNIYLTSGWFISPGFRFVQKGTKSEWSSVSIGQVNATVTNTYLELPVYLQWEIVNFGSKLFVVGGPTYSYLLRSRMEGTSERYGYSSRDSKDDYKSYDASIDLGLSIRSPIADNIQFLATTFYSFGFIKISSRESNEQSRDVRLMIGISYSISQ